MNQDWYLSKRRRGGSARVAFVIYLADPQSAKRAIALLQQAMGCEGVPLRQGLQLTVPMEVFQVTNC